MGRKLIQNLARLAAAVLEASVSSGELLHAALTSGVELTEADLLGPLQGTTNQQAD
ncbi:hypothetical protein [Sinomonas soli]